MELESPWLLFWCFFFSVNFGNLTDRVTINCHYMREDDMTDGEWITTEFFKIRTHINIRAYADHLRAAFIHLLKLWQPSSLFNTTSRLRSPLCLCSPVGDKDWNRKEDPKPTHISQTTNCGFANEKDHT